MSYGPVSDERSRNEVAEILSAAFGNPVPEIHAWLARAGYEELRRLVGADGRTTANLLRVPMGLWLGGRRITNMGIAGVGVRPDTRGRGVAREMMSQCLREARAEGFAVSTLYASTQSLYRSVGYELAGAHCEVTIPLAALSVDSRAIELRAFEPADRPAVVALGDLRARHHDGALARGPYVWSRVFEVRGEAARGVVCHRGDDILGYAFYLQKSRPEFGRFDLVLSDFVASTRAVAERLYTYFADHRSTGHELRFKAGPADPLVHLLPERTYRVELCEYWMLRVLDVQRALEGRGYPAGLSARLELEIDDPLFAENCGPFVLEVSGGEGRVERGGRGRLSVSIRDLAPLFTGHQGPRNLAMLNGLRGDEASMEIARALFAGSAPFMYEFF